MHDGHPQSDPYLPRRLAMVERQLRARGMRDERVLAAMERVPRHLFVPREWQPDAYGDHPLPIGEGQTISQPYIVAAMLEALDLRESDTALEIGTGSGYQTALLAELVARVYSVERHAALTQAAEAVLRELGYRNVDLIVADGSQGWPPAAPYDVITVGAAAPEIPPALIEQLREGGRLVVPVGSQAEQELLLVRKENGKTTVRRLEGCRFVPLIGEEGFPPPESR